MASLLELEKRAKQKGINATERNFKDTGANNVVENYIVGYSAEGALKNSIESLDGFCSYWDEQSYLRQNLSSPVEYITQVNTIFSSYRTIRKNLDGNISYLIGDWLLDCRHRFFLGDDRKIKGEWSKFLKENLCKDFEKTSAYEFMAIAEKLKQYRIKKLPLHTLKALLRARNSGIDIETLDLEKLSTKEILALRDKTKIESKTINVNIVKLKLQVSSITRQLKESGISDLNYLEVTNLKECIHGLLGVIELNNL
jgi:hypothetical protein